MTITYPNRTSLNAIVLSQNEHQLRAIVPGNGDVLAFSRTSGTWISENLEPVAMEFEWQRREAVPAPRLEECICSKELAAHLIQTLFTGDELQAAESEKLFVFSAAGTRVAMGFAELQAQ